MKNLFLALALLATPALARAETSYKCKSVEFSDQLAAFLRFGDDQKSGDIEVQYWNAALPYILINADFRLDRRQTDEGAKNFTSAVDSHNKEMAKFSLLPSKKSSGDAELRLKFAKWKEGKTFVLDCQEY